MRIAITGANAGIGRRAAERLVADGHEVVALCRDEEKARAAFADLAPDDRSRLQVLRLDLASSISVRQAAAELVASGPLDALISNAAVFDQSIRDARITADGHELFWQTNHLGPVELLARVSPALAAAPAPRVLLVASKGLIAMPRIRIRFDELADPRWFTPTAAYYHAKLAQVMTAVTLAERFGDRVDVSCLRVPAVRLDAERLATQPRLYRALYAPKNRAAVAPEVIAEVYARIIAEVPRHSRGPEVYVDEHERVAAIPRGARDPENRSRLWNLTQQSIGNPSWAWTDSAVSPPATQS